MNIADVLKKPIVIGVLAVFVGVLIGLSIGWGLWPVQWKDADPSFLRADLQDDYLRMAVDSYRVNGDKTLAIQRFQELGPNGQAVLERVKATYPDQAAFDQFAGIIPASSVVTTPVPGGNPTGPTSSPTTSYLIIAVIVIVLVIVFGLVAWRFVLPLFRQGTPGEPTAAMRAQTITSKTEVTDYEAMGQEAPIAQFVTTYVLGDDLFDDSFSIDSPSGEFLGECGIGISETIGVGDPKKVQAFEVWMFDKNDIQTVTKVLMSSHAFNDVGTVQRLEAKGEPILVERSKQIVMETAALQLVATVSDIEYGQGALPENSFFDRLTLEIAVWPKVTAPA